MLSRWERLILYTTHGGPHIDNNRVEDMIRPLALGRKNYLFAGSHNGTRNPAIISSLVGTCKLNGLDTYKDLFAILTKLPTYPVNKVYELLPCNISFEKPQKDE